MSSSSWKKYGGTNKLDNFNNLSVNSLIADYFILRNSYRGDWDISGALTVGSTSVFNDTATFKELVTIEKDFQVLGNLIVNATQMGGDTSIGGNLTIDGYVFIGTNGVALSSSGENHSLGINVANPQSTLDIYTVEPGQIQTIDISTDMSQNQNTLAKNQYNQSIQARIDPSQASIDFYIDTPYTNPTIHNPDGQIILKPQGIIEIDVSSELHIRPRVMISSDIARDFLDQEKLLIVSDPNTTTQYLPSIYETPSFKTATSTINVAPDSSSVQFVRFSTEQGKGVAIGGGSYPLRANTQIGTMGTTISNDHNEYLPAIQYFSSAPYRHQRTSVGINKYDNTYEESQYKHALEINGPTHITHGEMVPVSSLSNISENPFSDKIQGYIQDPITPTTIYAYGPTVSQNVVFEGYPITIYCPIIYRSTDNGYTWTRIIIDTTTSTPAFTILSSFIITNIYYIPSIGTYTIYGTYNKSNLINVYINTTNLIDSTYWKNGSFSDSLNPRNIQYAKVYEYHNPINNNIQLSTVISYNTTVANVIYDPSNSLSVINNLSSQNLFSTNTLKTAPATFQTNGFVFLCGSGGIFRFQKNASPPLLSPLDTYGAINNTTNYQHMDQYSTSTYLEDISTNYWIVAVGSNGQISTLSFLSPLQENSTNTSANWIHSTVNHNKTTWYKVRIYDESRAITIGFDTSANQSIIAYTNNRGTTWTADIIALNEMGLAFLFNTNSTRLDNIFPINDTQYLISRINPTTLDSDIYHAHFPTVWNRNSYTVLQIDGRTTATADMYLNQGASLNSIDPSVIIYPNNEVSKITIGNSTDCLTVIPRDFEVLNDTSLNNLYVSLDASFNSNVYIQLDLSVNRLIKAKDASFNGYVRIDNMEKNQISLDICGNTRVNDGYIIQSLSGENLQYGGSNTYGNLSTGTKNIVISTNSGQSIKSGSNNIIAGYNALLNNDGSNNVVIGTNAYQGTLNSGGSLISTNNSIIGANAFVNAKTITNSVGVGTFAGQFDISGTNNTYLGYNSGPSTDNSGIVYNYFTSIGANSGISDTTINGNNRILLGSSAGNETVYLGGNGQLFARTGQIQIGLSTDKLGINQPASNTYSLDISGNVRITNKSGYSFGGLTIDYSGNNSNDYPDSTNKYGLNIINSVSNNTAISFGVDTSGTSIGIINASKNGGVAIPIVINSLGGNVAIGKTIANKTLDVSGDVNIDSNFYLAKDASLNGNVFVKYDLSVNRLLRGQDASMNGNLYVKNNTTVDNNFYLAKDASLNGNVFVKYDLSVNRLLRGQDASMNGNLYVKNNTTVDNNFYLAKDASLNGNVFVQYDLSVNRLLRGQDASMNGNLYVKNNTTIDNNFYLAKDASLNGNVFVQYDLSVNRLLRGQDVSMNGNLYVKNTATIDNNFYLAKDASLNGNVFIQYDLSVNRLLRGQDASINGNLYVKNNTTIDNNFYLTKDASLNGNVFIKYDLSVNRLLRGQDASMNGNLYVNGNTQIMGNLYIQQNYIIQW